VLTIERHRYTGWRNYEEKWRELLRLDDTYDRDVLDLGCGVGLEALQYAYLGNRVTVADVHETNVLLASRVLSIMGYPQHQVVFASTEPPFIPTTGVFDVVHMSGVLHHIRDPEPVVRRVAEVLRPGGELRLMLYSDVGWRISTGTEPPHDVSTHPSFTQFVRFFDGVGEWADWYDAKRLERRFGHLLKLEACEHITADSRYLVATMIR
jgi:SAM-dependent methyltransferase